MAPLKSFLLKVTTITLLLSSFTSNAQSGGLNKATPEEKANAQTALLAKRLLLNEEQDSLVYAINLKYAIETETIVAKGRSRNTLQLIKDMAKRKDEELKNVLDENQYAEYIVVKGEMRSQMKRGRQRNGNKP